MSAVNAEGSLIPESHFEKTLNSNLRKNGENMLHKSKHETLIE